MVETKRNFPDWLRVQGSAESRRHVTEILSDLRLNTVCANALCPNLGKCFSQGVATFLIMGSVCTRNCRFCAISHGVRPEPPEDDEPERLAEGVRRLGLRYVVVTSVTRDDLPDGGADCFHRVIREVKRLCPDTGVEVLTPDFAGDEEALKHVLDAGPEVFNHNIETVRRLSSEIRSSATYDRSLSVLRNAVRLGGGIPVKSGLMLGLGETEDEISETLRDLRAAGVSLLTIGQYLPPTKEHYPLAAYVTPEAFTAWRDRALEIGFAGVMSAPLVRSSYHALELYASMCFLTVRQSSPVRLATSS
jgi:lipoic acid synthetase